MNRVWGIEILDYVEGNDSYWELRGVFYISKESSLVFRGLIRMLVMVGRSLYRGEDIK